MVGTCKLSHLFVLQTTVSAGSTMMIDSLFPSLVPAHERQPSTIKMWGTGLDACRVVALRHHSLGYGANVSALPSSSSTATFEFGESSWPPGSVQSVCVSDLKHSNLAVLTVYSPPNITSITPNKTSSAGGRLLKLKGTGFFSSSALQVSITSDTFSQVVDGLFVEDENSVHIEMPQFPLQNVNATVRIAMNGVNYGAESTSLSIHNGAAFRIGYLYVGPVNDFGWTYNWNIGRMEVDSRHPSIVESEYVENIPEEMITSTPPAEQEISARAREYCARNFDMVVANSFGFMHALAHMSYEPICNFWYNETSEKLTTIPMPTYFLHATGVMQTPTLATVFTKIYEMKYLSGVLVGNQMIAEASTNHLVGVVGAYPIPETYRHINAFIRGCVEADPLCRVAVIWAMTWHDDYIERSAAMKLWVEEGARVILQGTDSIEPQLVFGAGGPEACADGATGYEETRGCLDPDEVEATSFIPDKGFGIGYNSDMREVSGSSSFPTSCFHIAELSHHCSSTLHAGGW